MLPELTEMRVVNREVTCLRIFLKRCERNVRRRYAVTKRFSSWHLRMKRQLKSDEYTVKQAANRFEPQEVDTESRVTPVSPLSRVIRQISKKKNIEQHEEPVDASVPQWNACRMYVSKQGTCAILNLITKKMKMDVSVQYQLCDEHIRGSFVALAAQNLLSSGIVLPTDRYGRFCTLESQIPEIGTDRREQHEINLIPNPPTPRLSLLLSLIPLLLFLHVLFQFLRLPLLPFRSLLRTFPTKIIGAIVLSWTACPKLSGDRWKEDLELYHGIRKHRATRR